MCKVRHKVKTKKIILNTSKNQLDSDGYSLLEVLMALGILGIIMVGMTSIITQSTSSMGRVNALADAVSQIGILKVTLEDPITCRLNFAGKKPPVKNTIIKNKLNNTTLGDPVVNQVAIPPSFLNNNEAVLISNSLIPGMVLGSSGNQILNFKGNFITKIENSIQSKSVIDFPIFATINPVTGEILECSSKSFFNGGSDFNEKVCQLASTSEEEFTYDPMTGTCIPANEERCTAGDSVSARCEPDAIGLVKPILESCKVQNYAGENITYSRSFGGIKKVLPMVPYLCDGNENAKSVKCTLADDLDASAGAVCLACCLYKRKNVEKN